MSMSMYIWIYVSHSEYRILFALQRNEHIWEKERKITETFSITRAENEEEVGEQLSSSSTSASSSTISSSLSFHCADTSQNAKTRKWIDSIWFNSIWIESLLNKIRKKKIWFTCETVRMVDIFFSFVVVVVVVSLLLVYLRSLNNFNRSSSIKYSWMCTLENIVMILCYFSVVIFLPLFGLHPSRSVSPNDLRNHRYFCRNINNYYEKPWKSSDLKQKNNNNTNSSEQRKIFPRFACMWMWERLCVKEREFLQNKSREFKNKT